MKRRIYISILCLLLVTNIFPKEYFVSTTGNDKNSGTIENPYKTVKQALKVLEPGDICFLRGGDYFEVLNLKKIQGEENQPIVFQNYKNEKVVFHGDTRLNVKWKKKSGNIYSTKLDEDIWQLFYNDNMMTAARWPDGNMTDANFWNIKNTYRHFGKESVPGKIYDAQPISDKVFLKHENTSVPPQVISEGVNNISLGETGIDFTGAIAIMNNASWMTFASDVTHHEPGQNFFKYDEQYKNSGKIRNSAVRWTTNVHTHRPDFWYKKNIKAGEGYYFFEGEKCLDKPGEWWYKPKNKELLFISPDGKNPSNAKICGKNKDYSMAITNCSFIEFRGIDFFASTFKLTNSQNISIINSNIMYPSYSKRVLGNYDIPAPTMISNRKNISSNNKIINCRFEYMDGSALIIERGNDIVDNCLFHDVDYSCIGSAHTLVLSRKTTLRNSTLYNCGASEGVRNGKLVEYVHVYNNGNLQHDGSAFQCGAFGIDEAPILRYNWAHDTQKCGYRFDAGKNPKKVNGGGQVINNVTWNSNGLKVKGDYHLVLNNLTFDCAGGVIPMIAEIWASTNDYTITANNLTNRLSAKTGKRKVPAPGILKNNIVGNVDDYLRDPKNLDFRPKPGSKIINGGEIISKRDFKNIMLSEYVGKKPDIGAYEYGNSHYWIPGFKDSCATTPIPPDNSHEVAIDADLMWLEAYQATSNDIYFGIDSLTIDNADNNSKQYIGKQKTKNNICFLEKLVNNETYYWRIDAQSKDGKVIKGSVWKFTVK